MSSQTGQSLVRVLPTVPSLRRDVVNVALVTDDDNLASECARILEREGFSVQRAAHSGHALLACLQGTRVDVLIAELSMEEGSGPALARRMRRYNPDLHAIYLAKPGTVCDASNVLVRPFTREDLVSAVRAPGAR
jgi:DNA-binding NtrC family response regulator